MFEKRGELQEVFLENLEMCSLAGGRLGRLRPDSDLGKKVHMTPALETCGAEKATVITLEVEPC